ncbi:aminoglycoside phosphotransferase family protein [Nocardioides sp. C4-1]|uniref:aminoglycoside phosphotransferase family protein n=1 Tax=Nocardioides sp. C4-1 TaxID=3151851 RepID=UPI0032678C60
MATRGPGWAAWVDALPRLVRDLLDEWSLTPDGDPTHGECALVVPVLDADGQRAVLKVHRPDDESEHEHLALQHWHGRGAVQLLRADPRRYALLLERLHPTDLSELWDLEACEVVAGLYGRLHVPAPPQLRPLTSYVARWTEGLAALPRDAGVPHRMVEQAVSLGRSFVDDAASVGTMIHGDLHYENVLAADREPWLAIDPKPVSGDPHYEVAPLLWNRWDELAGDVRGGVRRRFHATIDAAGLDEDRARDWVVVRMLHRVLWEIEDGDPDPVSITTMLTIAKAVQD